jgi:hypothetical protein
MSLAAICARTVTMTIPAGAFSVRSAGKAAARDVRAAGIPADRVGIGHTTCKEIARRRTAAEG